MTSAFRRLLLSSRQSANIFSSSLLLLACAAGIARAQTSPVALAVTADHSPAKPGEAVVFTFTVANVSDVALPGSGVTVNWVVPNYVTGATAGATVSRPHLEVAAHQSFTFHQAYTVDPASAVDGSTVALTASALLDNATAASATASASATVATAPTLSVAVEDDAAGAAVPGQSITYTVTTTNRGTVAVAGPVLSVPVPVGTTFVSANAGGVVANGGVQWALGGLAPGATIIRRFVLQAGNVGG